MTIVTVTFPKAVVTTLAITTKHCDSADTVAIMAELDTINGEVTGTTVTEKLNKIKATKLAIEAAIEAAGVTVPVSTPFDEYHDFIALI